MQITECERRTTGSGETVAKFIAGKRSIQLVSTFENKATLDDLLYSIACRRIAEQLGQKRDNIELSGRSGTI